MIIITAMDYVKIIHYGKIQFFCLKDSIADMLQSIMRK